MTKKTAAAAETAANETIAAAETAASTYVEQVKQTLDSMQSKLEIPAAARDFVQRTAATAKERVESVHSGATNVATGAEKLVVSFVGGYANFARGLIDAGFANVQHALSTVEQLAAARSVSEAVQVQADFVRENAKANYERLKGAAETARTVVTEGAEQVQAELSRLNPYKKAA